MPTFSRLTVRSLVLFLASLFVLFTVCPQERGYAEESKPMNEKVAVGGGNGSGAGTITPDLFTGTMSYSIPIDVPEGRKGMSPGLSLDYRSNNGNGWVGVGWELEVGAVERSLKGGVNYSGDDYILRFAGGAMDLVNIPGTDEYRAKIEGAFLRVKRYPTGGDDSRAYWEVTDKSGMKYRYGYYSATRQDDPGDISQGIPADQNIIFKWCLDKVEDTNGNFMTFTYDKTPFNTTYVGQLYLNKIDYVGHTSSPQTTNYVKFYLESRTDAPVMYSTKFAVKTSYRLKTIEVRANNNSVRAYALAYDSDPISPGQQYSLNTERSVLSSVQQYDSDASIDSIGVVSGGTSLPAISMANITGSAIFENSQWSSAGDSIAYPGDFDGDGKTDFMRYDSGGTRVFLSTGTSFTHTVWSGAGVAPTYPGDFNGDGKTDIMRFYNGITQVLLSTGASFSAPEQWSTAGESTVYFGDFDGDGKTDFMRHDAGGTRVFLSTGASFTNTIWSGAGVAPTYPGDFNGDGKTDIMRFYNGITQVLLSTGASFSAPEQWSTAGESTVYFGDFNGDGKIDFMRYDAGGTRVFLSTGTSFTNTVWSGAGVAPTYLGDFNGDGKTDFMRYDSGGTRVFLSTGTSFTHSVWSGAGVAPTYLGDFNGDGKTDFMRFASGYTQVFVSKASSDLLTSISNGLGGTTLVTYQPSTQYENLLLPFPVQVVSSVTTSVTSGGIELVSTNTYSYEGGYYHIGERDFRGFNHVTIKGPAGPENEQTIVDTWYHQGNHTAVIAPNATVDTLKSYASATVGYMKGKPYRTKVRNGNGTVLSITTTAYAADTDGEPYFNPAQDVHSYIYGNGSNVLHTRTIYYYGDAYGNVTRENQYGDVSVTTDDRTVVRSYAINETPWIVGLLKKETVYPGIGLTGPVSSTDYYFDNAANCNEQSSNQVPEKGNVTRIVRWLDGGTSPEVRMAYDAYGNLICTRDAKGNIASLSYDSTSTFLTIATTPSVSGFPNGLSTITKYYGVDEELADNGLYGQVKSVTDPNNMVTTTEYDTFGRKKKVTMPDGTWSSWDYNDFGTVGSQHIFTNNKANLQTWTYFDGFGRTYLAKKSGPGGKKIATETEYNATGTVHRNSLPYFEGTETPRWTHYTYDDLGRAIVVTNEYDNATVNSCYDVLVTTVVTTGSDAVVHKKRQTKDTLGRLVTVEEFDVANASCISSESPYAITTYDYDVLGNLLYVHDAAGNPPIEMHYDTLGRKTYMNDPDMGEWSYTYDANGNLETQTDAMTNMISFAYDALNRITRKHYPSGTDVIFTYDVKPTGYATSYAAGRLSTMSDSTGTTKHFYDKMGRTQVTIKGISGITYTTITGYDVNGGRPRFIYYPGDTQASVWYSYDAGGNLSAVRSGPTSTAAAYAIYSNYTALGQPQDVLNGNGATTHYDYHADNSRLLSIVTSTAGMPKVVDLSYTYWNDGNIRSITDGVNSTRTYREINYDGLGRLKEVLNSGPTLTYFYDVTGNITSKEGVGYTQYSAHAVTRLSSGQTFTYDLNGNMTADGIRTIKYDYDNMPVSITKSGATHTFVYDGAGARVKKITPDMTTAYVGKLQDCPAGGICTNYIYAGGSRIAAKSGNDIYYYHQDHLGSTRVVTDKNGQEYENYSYSPFGGTQSHTGADDTYQYTGQEYDAETGLYYYNARYYNPSLGRFISPDTIVPNPANPQAFNRYSYVHNNPLNYTDPSGHIRISHPHLSDRDKERLRKPSVALGIQLLLNPTAGTYLLSRSEQGRNILAGEIVVGTAIATAYCGGCGAAPMLKGALVGEITGGYGAHRSGGDLLTGVVEGGAVGAATANLRVTPFGSGPWASFGNQIATDALRGGVKGTMTAALNGGDMYSGMVRGAASSAIYGQVNNVIGHTVGFIGSGGQLPTYNSTLDAFIYTGNPMDGGLTLGNVIYGPDDMLNTNPGLAGHEYIHTQQYKDFGAAFLPAYVAQFPVAALTLNNPFTYNLFEADARQQSGY